MNEFFNNIEMRKAKTRFSSIDYEKIIAEYNYKSDERPLLRKKLK